jgi:hypothetical protein
MTVLTSHNARAKLRLVIEAVGVVALCSLSVFVSASRLKQCAPVAQLDRALAYEARGRVFESPRAYQNPRKVGFFETVGFVSRESFFQIHVNSPRAFRRPT